MKQNLRWPWGPLVLGVLMLSGCASGLLPSVADQDEGREEAPPALSLPVPLKLADADWVPVTLPGKAETLYAKEAKEGRTAVRARSNRSASLLRRQVIKAAHQVGDVSFSWWVPQLLARANDAVKAGKAGAASPTPRQAAPR